MTSETLNVPERHLTDLIKVIRSGLANRDDVHPDTVINLLRWCRDEEKNLDDMKGGPQ